jgi:hypothetical protein
MPRDPEKRRLSNKASRERHKEDYLQYMKDYRASHQEQIQQREAEYREEHQEHIQERNKQYKQEHHDEELARHYKWREEHYEEYLEDQVQRTNARRNKLREQILDILGRKCVRCGYDADVRALQIDHVNGGGSQERKKLVYGIPYYRRILESVQTNSGEFQVLCANCNVIKRMEEQEHGKRRKRNETT